MKIRNFLKTVATNELEEEVKEELKEQDPEKEKAKAILNESNK